MHAAMVTYMKQVNNNEIRIKIQCKCNEDLIHIGMNKLSVKNTIDASYNCN